MAQLVERVLGKDEVGGSNPPSSSKTNPFPSGVGLFFSVNIGGFSFTLPTKGYLQSAEAVSCLSNKPQAKQWLLRLFHYNMG